MKSLSISEKLRDIDFKNGIMNNRNVHAVDLQKREFVKLLKL